MTVERQTKPVIQKCYCISKTATAVEESRGLHSSYAQVRDETDSNILQVLEKGLDVGKLFKWQTRRRTLKISIQEGENEVANHRFIVHTANFVLSRILQSNSCGTK
ncbi:hypothetical protein CEXT_76941 [Caerostris extrusa]|uniref:Uncharacterized protein n=1 Tax=Caerostris extrusa TaxID=172846 RepID=A0AAV4M8Y1_CAEEX|nr:hypothetical protein CEXT_76941 [Caerostris extrusa]